MEDESGSSKHKIDLSDPKPAIVTIAHSEPEPPIMNQNHPK